MKNKMIKLAGAAAAIVALAQTVQATPIAGSVGFTGLYTQVGGTQGQLNTATSFTINSAILLSDTGTFAGATSSSFVSSISVNPATSLVGHTLWTVTVGSTTYTFTVTTETETLPVTTPANAQLALTGLGTVTDGNSADTTSGSWQFTASASGASFTWQNTSAVPAPTPDGGTTVLLLGAALSGLAFAKRKLTA